VTRISKTGDLLIVWNQVSGDEVRAGYRRSRLSSAISKDDGKSWQHFRTIDRCVLPPTGYVMPEPERLIRALDYVGVLPDDFGSISYPSIHVVGETVFVTASRSQHDPSSKKWNSGRVMYRLPLDWFYQEEPALTQGPKLLLRVPATDLDGEWVAHQIPADHYQGRFLCNSRDLAKVLKSPVGRLNLNLYGPVEQLITCLGWTATFDRDHLKDPQNPRMIVTAQLPGMQRKP
jgi:hypothetical protein